MNKRLLLLLFSFVLLLMLFALVGCSALPLGTTDGSTAPTTTTVPQTTAKPIPAVGNPSAIGYPSTKNDNLPTLHINTADKAPIVSRDEYLSATVSVSGTLDDETYGFEDRASEVRCRGNFTYTGTEKKSYRLKFEKKINLFGQGKGEAKSWVLLANHCDKSFLRNHLAFTLGNMLDNISYTTSSSFVQLYINGEYAGVYQVAEQHNINENRIDILEDPDTIDTDYLIERDSYADEDGVEGKDFFRINRTKYNIKTDFPDSTLAKDKCEFLRDYFQKTHDAIKEGNQTKVARYIDLDSFIDTFILQAMVKNIDVGYSSFFMVKKAGGKIYFTCPWDFDLSLGNDDRLDHGQVEGMYVGEKSDLFQQHEWFYLLMNEEWFCNKVRARWNEVGNDLFEAMLREIDRFLLAFNDDMSKNFELWKVLNKKINQEPLSLLKLKTYRANVTNLREWVVSRYNYVHNVLTTDEIYNLGGVETNDWWGGGGWWN